MGRYSKNDIARLHLRSGARNPYDAPEVSGVRMGPPTEAADWAHPAARGVISDLTDRRDIKTGFRDVDEDIRVEIVASLAAIIRMAHADRENIAGESTLVQRPE